jgi:hypothetical protein
MVVLGVSRPVIPSESGFPLSGLMVILNRDKLQCRVRCGNGLCTILFKTGHRPDRIDVLDDDVRLLVDCLEEAELFSLCIDRVLEDAVLVQVGPGTVEVHGEFLELSGALYTGTLLDKPEPRMLVDELDHPLAGDVLFCRDLDRLALS